MNNKIIIAVDAMGGEDSPKKVINGIELSLKENNDNFFHIYGDKNQIDPLISKNELISKNSKIFHSEEMMNDLTDDKRFYINQLF